MPAITQPRLRQLAALVVIIALVLGIPAGVVLASHQFSDVPSSNAFHSDIDALVDSGVTAGCGGGRYCPKANVTREQMAAFLNRLGALSSSQTPVVNATKLDGLDSNSFERSTSVISGTVDYGNVNARVLLDPRTGADVRSRTIGNSAIRIVNTDPSRSMQISGTITSYGNAPEGRSIVLAPGEVANFTYQTVQAHYLDLVIVSSGATAGGTDISRLSCAVTDIGGHAWVSCVLVG